MSKMRAIFDIAVWDAACHLHSMGTNDIYGLSLQPQSIRAEYKEKAVQELRAYLAEPRDTGNKQHDFAPQIEVTAQMEKAGLQELYDVGIADPAYLVRSIYTAIELMRLEMLGKL